MLPGPRRLDGTPELESRGAGRQTASARYCGRASGLRRATADGARRRGPCGAEDLCRAPAQNCERSRTRACSPMKSIFSTQNLRLSFCGNTAACRAWAAWAAAGTSGRLHGVHHPGRLRGADRNASVLPHDEGGRRSSERWCAGAVRSLLRPRGLAGRLRLPRLLALRRCGCTGFCSSDITSTFSNVTIRNSVSELGAGLKTATTKTKRGWPKPPPHKLGGASGLFGRSRAGGTGGCVTRRRTAGGALLALVRELLLALQFFVRDQWSDT